MKNSEMSEAEQQALTEYNARCIVTKITPFSRETNLRFREKGGQREQASLQDPHPGHLQ